MGTNGCQLFCAIMPAWATAAKDALQDHPNADKQFSTEELVDLPGHVGSEEPEDLPECLKARRVRLESFHEIPIIDLSQDEAVVVEQLRYACEVVGFMQVTQHGVSEELQERHDKLQRDFFALPEAEKEKLSVDSHSPVRGYFGRGVEDLDQVLTDQVDAAGGEKLTMQTRNDMKEVLDLNGVPWSKAMGGYTSEVFAMPSRLPPEEVLPGLKDVLEEYAAEMLKLGRRLMSLFALVLGHPRDFFEQHLTNPTATHRLLHYWPQRDFKSEIGVGEHTDYGLLTMLKQDSVGGLQVWSTRDNAWVHCTPVKNAYVINVGDMMGRWTNGHFKSTIHRVVNASRFDRYSAAYFLEPNLGTVITRGGLLREAAEYDGSSPSRTPTTEEETAEAILERFYRASGQLKERPAKESPHS